MHFDDRLATVLRHRAETERAARTQFRQLIDLLGGSEGARDGTMLAAAWLRLGALGETIPAPEREVILREPGLRIRSAKLAAHLAQDEPRVAAAALAIVRLDDEAWRALVPRLPIRARGFLRLRRDLSPAVVEMLERLGVHDRALPLPQAASETAGDAQPSPTMPAAPDSFADPASIEDLPRHNSITGLVRRIEAFQRARTRPTDERTGNDEAPLLPLGEHGKREHPPLCAFAFTTNSEGSVDWAEENAAPAVFGLRLDALGDSGGELATRTSRRQPLRQVSVELEGAAHIAGRWVVDATPRFASDGRFCGYAGRFRRLRDPQNAAHARSDEESDRLRQLLHELRTPVNAIQGFAEVIQQQLFRPVPHNYRALAAGIAGDAAHVLAGFDELDRLARLDTGALELEQGQSDFAAILRQLSSQLDDALLPRGAHVDFACGLEQCLVPLACADAEALAWRLLATLAGAAGEAEKITLRCAFASGRLALACSLPRTLAAQEDIFSATLETKADTLNAGSFGAGFALRLARAEARAARGDLVRQRDLLNLVLPARVHGVDAQTTGGAETGA